MKVKQDFYCMVEKRSYKRGDTYKGKRKDIAHLLEGKKQNKKAPETKKGAISKK